MPSRHSSAEVDEDLSGFHLDRIGLEIHTRGCSLCGAGTIVETTIVLWTFDDVVHYEAIGKMNLLMRAQAIGALARDSGGGMAHRFASQS